MQGNTWDGTFTDTNEIGTYNVTYYANLTDGFSHITTTTTSFYVKNISVTLNLNDTIVNSADRIEVSGYATLQPDATNITNNTISIWQDNTVILGGNWWNSTFERKKAIHVNNTDNEIINYSLLLNITYDPDMNPDFSDLRFTNSAGDTSLSYWIENNISSTYADVWVKIPYTLTNTTNTTIYMYYGNTTAVNTTGNATNTFIFWDDFEDNDISDWNIVLAGGASCTVSGGIVHTEAIHSTERCYMQKIGISNEYDNVIESRAKQTFVSGNSIGVIGYGGKFIYMGREDTDQTEVMYRYYDPGNVEQNILNIDVGVNIQTQYNIWSISFNHGTTNYARFAINYNFSTDYAVYASGTTDIWLGQSGYNTGHDTYFDWVRKRKFLNTTPITSF